MRWELAAIAASAGGRIVGDAAAASGGITGFAIDSRVLEAGTCFVALTADRDGHDFVGAAFSRGAVTALVAREVEGVRTASGASAPMVVVDDPLRALGRLGAVARHRLGGVPLVAVAGSVGKTGTKDLTVAALAAGRTVHGSIASLNNEAGVPLTLLAADDALPPDVVVNEFGERKPGDLAYLCDIAAPTHAVITNVGLAHAEFLGGVEGVAREMQVVLDRLTSDGFAVVNDDDPASATFRSDARLLRVGTTAAADVHVDAVALDDHARVTARLRTPWGAAPIHLELRGRHQATNAAMAVAVACGFGVPLAAAVEGVGSVVPDESRMRIRHLASGATVVDDSYNASPASTAAALEAFGHLATAGRRIAVLGEMRELGAASGREHERVGELAVAAGVRELVVVGDVGEWIAAGAVRADPGITVSVVSDAPAAADLLHDLGPGDAVLLKASRAVGLERVASRLDAVAPVPTPDIGKEGRS